MCKMFLQAIDKTVTSSMEKNYIIELGIGVELHSVIVQLSVHVGRLPVLPGVRGRGDDNDPAVPTGRGSGEDDGKQLQSQQEVTEVVHLQYTHTDIDYHTDSIVYSLLTIQNVYPYT